MTQWYLKAQAMLAPIDIVVHLPDGLTMRELEVLRLLAVGLSNRDIAARLVLSVATVQRHVANIYLKIDAPGQAPPTQIGMGRRTGAGTQLKRPTLVCTACRQH